MKFESIIVAISAVLFLQGFLLSSYLPAVLGVGLITYLLYVRMSFQEMLENEVEIKRELPNHRIFEKEPFTTKLKIKNKGNKQVHLEIKQELPNAFKTLNKQNKKQTKNNTLYNFLSGLTAKLNNYLTNNPLNNHNDIDSNSNIDSSRLVLGPDEEKVVEKEIRPLRKGEYSLDGVQVDFVDPRGFYRSTIDDELIVSGDLNLRVYQSQESIREAEKTRKHMRMPQFEEKMLRTMGFPSNEIQSLREYEEGDDVRLIEWKKTAKIGELITKEVLKENDIPIRILLDCTEEMRQNPISNNTNTKIDYSTVLTLQLTKTLIETGHQIGLITYNDYDVINNVKPDGGTKQQNKIKETLIDLPQPQKREEYTIQTNYNQKLDINPTKTRKNNENKISNFLSNISPFFTQTGTEFNGIFNTLNLLRNEESQKQLLIIITDLESHIGSYINIIKNLREDKHQIVLVTPYTPTFHLQKINKENLEKLYKNYESRKKLLRKLTKLGVWVVETGPTDILQQVLQDLKEEMG